jgi:hypothetical protein
MLPSIAPGAFVALSPVVAGVRSPLALSIVDDEMPCGAIRVLSRCVDEADDSFAESGLVGCFRAAGGRKHRKMLVSNEKISPTIMYLM